MNYNKIVKCIVISNKTLTFAHIKIKIIKVMEKKTIQEVYNIIKENSFIKYAIDIESINLIDENVPNTVASITLKFYDDTVATENLFWKELNRIIFENGLSMTMDLKFKIIYVYYPIEK